MNATDFHFGFRVLGDCRQPRRLVDWGAAFGAYAADDERARCGSEGYLSAFAFGDDFAEHLRRTGSTAGFVGPCWGPWLWLDVDRDGDLPGALADARRLAVAIVDTLQLAEDDVLTFLSGGKGFHLGLPCSIWAPEPGPNFHRVARRFAETVAERAGVSIDAGVYDRVRCFRAPNSRHPRTGLHKRRLAVDALMHLNVDAILQLAAKSEAFELPTPTYRSEPAAQLWAEAAELVRHEAEAKAARVADVAAGSGTARLNRSTLQFIADGAGQGDRHRLCYSAAANLAELGAPLPLCVALLTEAAADSGLPPTDARRAIENGWSSARATDAAPNAEAKGGAT